MMSPQSEILTEAETPVAAVGQRPNDLDEACSQVMEDQYILSGTPVIRGTRIPVHDVGALFNRGETLDSILQHYPALTARQIKLAAVYADAVPEVARPRVSLESLDSKIVTVLRYDLPAPQ